MSQSQINEVRIRDAVGISALVETPESATDPVYAGLKRSTWIQIGVITVLFGALFWPNLRRLWDKTNPIYGEANWGHAICIPFIGLYYLYVNREQLLSPPPARQQWKSSEVLKVWMMLSLCLLLPMVLIHEELTVIFFPAAAAAVGTSAILLPLCMWRKMHSLIDRVYEHSAGWFGGFVMFFGIAVFQYAIFPGQNDFLKDLGMVITLFGVVLALGGWSVMKIAWFPIAFLVCGLPWPGLVYSKVAGPLQQLAANVAVWTLQLTGVEAAVNGTKISMIGGNGSWRTLNVAEACAGMRSLMTFISVAAAVAFLSSRPLWQKIIVVIFAVPIAISCNVMRVSGQGLLDRYVSHSLSENFAHQFVGLIMLIPAFLLILLVGWILDQIFVEQIDRRVVAIAPKVITRATAATPAAVMASNSAPRRSLASARSTDETAATLAATLTAEKRPVATPPPPAKPSTPPAAKPVVPPPTAKSVTPPPAAKLPPRPAAAPRSPAPPRAPGAPKTFVPPPPSVRFAPRRSPR